MQQGLLPLFPLQVVLLPGADLPLHIFDAGNENGTFTFSASDRDFNATDPRTFPDRFSVRVPGDSDFSVKGKEIGVFAQDTWTINRLTLNYNRQRQAQITKELIEIISGAEAL